MARNRDARDRSLTAVGVHPAAASRSRVGSCVALDALPVVRSRDRFMVDRVLRRPLGLIVWHPAKFDFISLYNFQRHKMVSLMAVK